MNRPNNPPPPGRGRRTRGGRSGGGSSSSSGSGKKGLCGLFLLAFAALPSLIWLVTR